MVAKRARSNEKMRIQFGAKLSEEFVTEINKNSPTEAKDVHNFQREELGEKLRMRLILPNTTWAKEIAVVSCESTISEVEKCLKACNLEITDPHPEIKHSNVEGYLVRDKETKDLKIIPIDDYNS